MVVKRSGLNTAVRFHGHLGPYLVLGMLAGECALKKLGCKKYFGLEVTVFGANQRPQSCLIDGLQLSTGATYGKGNIHKRSAKNIKIVIFDRKKNKQIILGLKKHLIKRLCALKDHRDAEILARALFESDCREIFILK